MVSEVSTPLHVKMLLNELTDFTDKYYILNILYVYSSCLFLCRLNLNLLNDLRFMSEPRKPLL